MFTGDRGEIYRIEKFLEAFTITSYDATYKQTDLLQTKGED